MRVLSCLLLPAALLVASPCPSLAQEQPAVKGFPEISPEQVDRAWAQSWKEIAHFYIAWKGEFYSFPDYSKEYPSSVRIASRRVTEKVYAAAPALAALTQSYQDDNGLEKKRTLKKDPAEIEAAVKALPAVEAGAYGWIRSGRVERAEGEDTIVLRQIQLLDTGEFQEKKQKMREKLINQDIVEFDAKVRANLRPRQHFDARNLIEQYRTVQREAFTWWFAERDKAEENQRSGPYQFWEWRVVGFKTSKVVAGMRWPADKGVQLAILEIKNHVVLAAPAAFLDKGLTEKEASELLEKVGLTKAQFVALVKEAKKRDEKGWVALVMHAIEDGGKLPQPVKKSADPAGKNGGKKDDLELVK